MTGETQPTATLLFIRAADAHAPCLDYTVRLLTLLAPVRVQCVSPEQAAAADHTRAHAVLLYAGAEETAGMFAGLPSALKTAQSIAVARSGFWEGFRPPGHVSAPGDIRQTVDAVLARALPMERDGTDLRRCQLDLLATCFWIVTRAEEYFPFATRDVHGRFLAANSAVPLAAYDQPLVARALLLLAQDLGLAQPKGAALGATQNVAITHDLDLLQKYQGGAGMRRMLGRMVREPGKASGELKRGLPVLLGSGRDPYDSFDALFTIKERISAPSTWFFMTESGGQDADYELSDARIRNVLIQARNYRDEFALHSSWNAEASPNGLATQRAKVARSTSAAAAGVRPHYLRFTVPQTWRLMAEAGFRYSSSLGFADRCGFRCGWSGPFRPFDLLTMQELPIIEIPLVCMDMTLSVYEKVSAELALERLTNLLDASCEGLPLGAFVFLWHNTIADRAEHPGYWDTFEYFFSIASGSSTFVTLSHLCDQFDARYGTARVSA